MMNRKNVAWRLSASRAVATILTALSASLWTADPALAGAPDNDNCIDRMPVTEGPTPFDTTEATTDGPALTCGFGPAFRDAWFNYTPTCTGNEGEGGRFVAPGRRETGVIS